MALLPRNVVQAWEEREGPVILATTDESGCPNIIYATCVGLLNGERLVVADNYFDKTRKNLLRGGRGAILFRDKAGKAYQVKGILEYHREGKVFDFMKSWNPPQHPGHAAAAIRVEEVFSGSDKLC